METKRIALYCNSRGKVGVEHTSFNGATPPTISVNITYDRNGNVLSLLRYGNSGTTPLNNYTSSYEGNRALMINGTSWYEYDISGYVKERQNISMELDPYIDFGARFYDPLTARWLNPDLLADKYTSLTQNNNRDLDSVFLINEDGEKIKPEIVNRRCIRLTKNGRL